MPGPQDRVLAIPVAPHGQRAGSVAIEETRSDAAEHETSDGKPGGSPDAREIAARPTAK